jgi:hypothetical protein
MGQKLPPAEAALYRAVSEALLHEWDPCGVSEYPEAQDEYHAYLPQVYRLVAENAGAEAIGDYLYRIETERMGMTTARWRLDPVAERLAALRSHHLPDAPSS